MSNLSNILYRMEDSSVEVILKSIKDLLNKS